MYKIVWNQEIGSDVHGYDAHEYLLVIRCSSSTLHGIFIHLQLSTIEKQCGVEHTGCVRIGHSQLLYIQERTSEQRISKDTLAQHF